RGRRPRRTDPAGGTKRAGRTFQPGGRATSDQGGKRQMKQLLVAAACSAALAACAAAPTVYAPATGPAASGFTEYRIEPGRYRVTYRGGAGAPPAQVADYALLRAAELTLADGYDWFRIADRWREGSSDRGPQVSVGGGSAT